MTTNTVALTGNDTSEINGRVLTDLANGDSVTITFPNELTTVSNGKNGNALYAFNASGNQVDVEIRLLAGSSDDKFMNSLFQSYKTDPAAFVLLTGNFTKRVGDGSGAVSTLNYSTSGGCFTQGIDSKENLEGDTEQAVALYRLRFANNQRSI